jgi:hypothetical protein
VKVIQARKISITVDEQKKKANVGGTDWCMDRLFHDKTATLTVHSETIII